MSTPTLVEAQEMYSLYIEAEKVILKNQSYTIKDRTYTRADLRTVVAERRRWAEVCTQLTSGGIRSKRGLPRDR